MCLDTVWVMLHPYFDFYWQTKDPDTGHIVGFDLRWHHGYCTCKGLDKAADGEDALAADATHAPTSDGADQRQNQQAQAS